MASIQRALLSVTDKTGLAEFAKKLAGMGVELISTGGTAKLLRDSGISVKDISDLTGFPEMLDGRVKTLHPKVHGGILHIRANQAHLSAIAEHGIQPIDMVVVNLYAFEKTASKPGVHFEEIIENIDIGGPSMVRSAAKNFQDVAIVTSPGDYEAIAQEMSSSGGALSLRTKWALAQKAFATTAAYDSAIAGTLDKISVTEDGERFDISGITQAGEFPESLRLGYKKAYDLRYGENPHQKAALYSDGGDTGIANGAQLQGKELSFNNIVDMQAAWDLSTEFQEPFCAIIKHTNPCGSALGKNLAEAFQRAFECDPVSAFGGVIALNGPVDLATAEAIAGLRHNGQALFIECIVAPKFDQGARERFAKRKDLRLVEIKHSPQKWAMKAVSGGMLVQDNDLHQLDAATLQVVTERKPTEAEMRDLLFAWKIGKHVKSNAILYAKDLRSVGVGAGQMSRVDSAKIGAQKAVLSLEGSVVASDAFFPFPDGVEEIARAGARAVIQPGGSKMDSEVIATANRLGMAMVLTGVRHFRH
jgi:phosphoribosylaminoimidazolecarboxamide formyltransferase / IMP cyclohydrolase